MKKLDRLLSGVRFCGMRAFVFLFIVVVVVVDLFRFLLIWDLLRPAPTCFLIVFFTVFFKACLGVSSWLLCLLIRVLLEQVILFQYVLLLVL